ncbi:CYFA0S01e02256g1_1 [Cyberlindnera fabianii]|uniref:CYFA0S01e02256g1_1 n=1 Tax=Cyberlindnera fabianii TaxID=36022 RepID=A0A061AP98_CYBFA|nr:CYFA0S01e02256g1_1 [Cyberlindnera fabianii]
MQRLTSTKRSGEDFHSSRPTKRNSVSPKSSIIFTPPQTPKKNQSRSSLTQRSKLLTTFKNAFTSSSPSRTPQSPISDDESAPSSPDISSVSSNNQFVSSPVSLYTPEDHRVNQKLSSLNINEKVCRTLNFEDDVNDQLKNLHLTHSTTIIDNSHAIFHIPEILNKIISYVDEFTSVPCEESPVRRRPLSYQHALLIYKDEQRAHQVWSEAMQKTMDENGNPVTNFQNNVNSLYSCMLVNKLWYRVTLEVASTKLFFSDETKWQNFVTKTSQRRHLTRSKSSTRLFVMHKLTKAHQLDVDLVSPTISGNLEWIEMYICPKILPTPQMLSGSLLKKLVMPGSKVVDDGFLRLVAKTCPNLEHLDLRACGLVSDAGITHLASRCKSLVSLNLGRHTHTSRITDLTLHAISIYTHIETLGVAGCAITDRGLWELALRSSDSIQRLSLNNCSEITDSSIPRILEMGYLPNLTVLEIRHLLNLTNVAPLVSFKRKKEQMGEPVLIEGCEVLEYRMRSEEWRQDMSQSARMLNEIQNWCNEVNDGDAVLSRKTLSRAVSV